ncbi:MAG: hypothetical protein COX62_06000 [Deltaproteobacteria bacterium CG_4_10_14_0_2_um_filter_43_8]|nr:MAG: hypothetical protein COV43_01605 [Deltaproteobacteria bacterium CG11_big_fil_rev_8_21_14_0_20_42_23]PJA19785.1 MAG: hypothetical protein COX62_06000 [Deltaproteobacteria bacterium CG_4_10_14_0_2_um_filter_43_8]PJC64665.1 MAG: hypothetical protein CO021_03120 [Deltaproteobacteria bacterium CG_4_9_14_0_2_um_filter_42_21]
MLRALALILQRECFVKQGNLRKAYRHDAVKETLLHGFLFFKERWKQLLASVLVLVGVLASVYGFSYYKSQKNEQASLAYYMLQKEKLEGEKEREALKHIVAQYENTATAKLVQFKLLQGYISDQNKEEAESIFRALEKTSRNDPFFHTALLFEMANFYRDTKSFGLAAKLFEEASHIKGNVLEAESLFQLALCFELDGKKAEAKHLYQELLERSEKAFESVKERSQERLIWLSAVNQENVS